jgi:hypothetical protein
MLSLFISKLKGEGEPVRVIIGGDWNTVIDSSPVAENQDLHLMKTFPNHSQHVKLLAFMKKFDLIDPYHICYPDGAEFSYAPFGTLRSNRSRLDFFLVSRPVLPTVLESKIVLGKLCKLFDHSSISLLLGDNKKSRSRDTPKIIRNSMLKKECFRTSVHLESKMVLVECFNAMDPDRDQYLNTLKRCGREFSNLKKLQIKNAIYGNVPVTSFAEKIGEINQSLNTVPATSELWHRSVHNPNVTFNNLLNRIRTRALSTQKHLIRIQDLAIAEIK